MGHSSILVGAQGHQYFSSVVDRDSLVEGVWLDPLAGLASRELGSWVAGLGPVLHGDLRWNMKIVQCSNDDKSQVPSMS